MASDVVMFGSFLLQARHGCGPALCLEKGSHLPAVENTRQKEGRCGGSGRENSGCSGSGTSQGLQMAKRGVHVKSMGEKMSVMPCSPLRVLENIVVSDAMDKDVIFPIGINILRLE